MTTEAKSRGAAYVRRHRGKLRTALASTTLGIQVLTGKSIEEIAPCMNLSPRLLTRMVSELTEEQRQEAVEAWAQD